jgi:hypothetical protein
MDMNDSDQDNRVSRIYDIKINNTTVCKGKTTYVLYSLEIYYNISTNSSINDIISWVIHRRYSEFVALRKELCKNVRIKIAHVPELTTTWNPFSNTEDRFVEERKVRLLSFLRAILKQEEALKDVNLRKFLHILQNEDDDVNEMKNKGSYYYRGEMFNPQHPLFGVKCFVYNNDQSVLLTGSEDIYSVSRFDSFNQLVMKLCHLVYLHHGSMKITIGLFLMCYILKSV